MKKLGCIFLLFVTTAVFSQSNGITYQAVIYMPGGQNAPGVNVSNVPMTNKNICLQFSLVDGNNRVEYQEEVKVKTDEFGMVNIAIGKGVQSGGYASSYAAIVWNALSQKNLQVAFDSTGLCNQFEPLSNEPINSIPFANAAITAGNVTGVVALVNGGTGATTATGARANLGIENVDNTSDLDKPISNATKNYVDNQLASGTIVDADATTKGKIQLAGDLAGTAAVPTVPGLALKENGANKSTTITLGTSNVLFPTQNAVKTYVDTAIAGATIVDADATTKGKIQLAGDLAGTAAAPTVPGLALKENTANKSTDIVTDAASTTKYPSVKLIKDYVDALNAAAGVADGSITSAKIADGTIVNDDVAATAAIVDTKLATIASAGKVSNSATTATNANTASAIVARDVNGDFAARTITASLTGNVTGDVTGNVTGNVSGTSANVTGIVAGANGGTGVANTGKAITLGGNLTTSGSFATTLTTTDVTNVTLPTTGTLATLDGTETLTNKTLTSPTMTTPILGVATANSVNKLVITAPATSATLTIADGKILTVINDAALSGSNTGDQTTITGNAGTATTLATPRNINGVAFDGSANITVTADASTLTGTSLNSTIVGSSLTSVTTNANLTGPITSVGNATTISDSAVTSAKIADGTIVEADIANAAVTNAKLNKANISLSGFGAAIADVALGGNKLTDVADPISDQDVATKKYVDRLNAAAGVADGSITYTKIQTVATDKVLGRFSANAGVVEEIATIGTGNVVRATSPSLVTPVLGAATATSVNGLTPTALATGFTIAGGTTSKTLTVSGDATVSGTNTGDQTTITGNAGTATKLAATKNINGVAFDGSADITVTADASTLTGTSLNSTIVGSSLTSVGTLSNLTVTNPIAGSITGNAATATKATNINGGSLGSVPYQSAAGTTSLLAGNTSATAKYLTSTGDGTTAAAPTWTTISAVPYTGATGAVNLGAYDLTVNEIKIGIGAGAKTSNTAVGRSALITNTSGFGNTGFGAFALNLNTTGDSNTALGYATLQNNSSGQYNTAVGTNALIQATGTGNTAIGYNSQAPNVASSGTYNTSLGYSALGAITSGYKNTALGSSAMYGLTTGNHNIAIGDSAGATVYATSSPKTKGDFGIYLGYRASPLADNISNEIVIGSSTTTNGNNTGLGANSTVLGNTSTQQTKIYGTLTVSPNAAGTSLEGLSTTIAAQTAGIGNDNPGGSVNITAGNGNGAGLGGNIVLNPGTSNTASNKGKVNVNGQVKIVDGTQAAGKVLTSDATGLASWASIPSTNLTTGVTGILPEANGGTGSATKNFVDLTTAQTIAGAKTFSGNTSVGGTLGITGATTLSSTLGVNGNTTIGGTTTLNGNTSVSGSNTLTVGTGATTLGGTLVATGAATLSSTLGVTGDVAVNTNKFTIAASTGNTVIAGTIKVAGGTPGAGKVLVSDATGLASWSANSNGGASLISATATMAATDTYNLIVFSGSTVSQTITLPSATDAGAGREITIKNIASVPVTINATAGNLISDSTTTGATSLSIGIEPSNNWIKAISTGSNWIILRALF